MFTSPCACAARACGALLTPLACCASAHVLALSPQAVQHLRTPLLRNLIKRLWLCAPETERYMGKANTPVLQLELLRGVLAAMDERWRDEDTIEELACLVDMLIQSNYLKGCAVVLCKSLALLPFP